MWDLKPNAPAEIRGPFWPIATTVPGMQICEHMPRLAQQAQHYALLRSVSHNNHNHTPMIYYTLTGRPVEQPSVDNDVRPPQRTDFPHLGAVLARMVEGPGQLPGYIAMPPLGTRSSTSGEFVRSVSLLRGGDSGFLGPIYDPLLVRGEVGTAAATPAFLLPPDTNGQRLEQRQALLTMLDQHGPVAPGASSLDTLREQAVLLCGSAQGQSSLFSLDNEPVSLQERYGTNRFGKALLLARRLAEAGVPMIAIHFNEMTVCDGWDTHSNNFTALQGELLPMVDRGLSALLEDLQQRGMYDQTLVAVFGEFGRTPRINGNAGRDHWGLCQTALFAGAGIRPGQVVGSSDRIAAYPHDDPCDPVDLHATIYHCMGLDPHTHLHDHLQRPWPLCTGQVISKLLA
jgi:hypothetical protein